MDLIIVKFLSKNIIELAIGIISHKEFQLRFSSFFKIKSIILRNL